MHKKYFVLLLILFVLSLLYASVWAANIDFEGLPAGTIVDSVSEGKGISGSFPGSVKVFAVNPSFGEGVNAAVIFDSSCSPFGDCSGGDQDLGTPNVVFGGPGEGIGGEDFNDTPFYNILIIGEDLRDNDGDGLVDDPDDENLPGARIEFDFSSITKNKKGTVTFNGVTIMHIERKEVVGGDAIHLIGPGGLDANFSIPETGDNGVVVLDGFNLEGVSKAIIYLNGSGAVESLVIEEIEDGICWLTTGGFIYAEVDAGNGKITFGGNVGPPPSGAWEIIDHAANVNFHSNDVEIIECLSLGTTGPQQPGGKKGFDIDKATFSGTGRLNGMGGFCFTGFVIDSGEPQGKKSNGFDQIGIEITDCTSNVVYEMEGQLTGGNVQIHPPVGKP